MSAIGKVFLGLSLALGVASAALGFMIAQQKTQYATQLTNVESSLKSFKDLSDPVLYSLHFKESPVSEPGATISKIKTKLGESQETVTTLTTDLSTTKKDLESTNAEKTKLNNQLTEATNKLKQTEEKLTSTQKKVSPLEAEVKKFKEGLKGEDPAFLFQQIDSLKSDLKKATDEKKQFEDESSTLKAEVEKLREFKHVSETKEVPKNLLGKIVAVNKPWSFVVLDIGQEDLLVDGVELTVFRGEKFIGKIRTVSVDAETAVADILPDWSKGDPIQVGDSVIY